MYINLNDLTPNKVSINLNQYSMIWMGDTGIGKTTTMMNFLKELAPEKEPFFLEFEDRYQNIPGIMAVKIDTMSDFKSVIGQLRNPAFREKFSCIIVDTLDKYEEFCERYVLENRDAEILKDVGGFGEGSLRFKSALRNIGVIQSLGYTVHSIAQSSHSKDFDTKKESDSLKLNKNTFAAEATAVLQKNLGLDDNGNVKMFDSLRDSQIDLTKVIVMELQDLVDKFAVK